MSETHDSTGPRIKPQIIADLREWAEFEQDGGNVEQGAAIDIILDWYERQRATPSRDSSDELATLAAKYLKMDAIDFGLAVSAIDTDYAKAVHADIKRLAGSVVSQARGDK